MHKFVITQHPEDETIFLSDETFKAIELERKGEFPVDDIFILDSWLKFDDAVAFSNILGSLSKSSEDYSSLTTIIKHLKKGSEITYHPEGY